MVTSAQIRAARALLNWTVRDLAEKSGVHRNTITRMETAEPRDGGNATGYSIQIICKTLQDAGIVFTAEDGNCIGVKMVRIK